MNACHTPGKFFFAFWSCRVMYNEIDRCIFSDCIHLPLIKLVKSIQYQIEKYAILSIALLYLTKSAPQCSYELWTFSLFSMYVLRLHQTAAGNRSIGFIVPPPIPMTGRSTV